MIKMLCVHCITRLTLNYASNRIMKPSCCSCSHIFKTWKTVFNFQWKNDSRVIKSALKNSRRKN